MARFVTFFSYTSEAWARLLENPGDRSGPVGATIADAGGRLVSLDYLFGERDGMAVFEAPDSATAAAVALVVGSSGAFRSVATHELPLKRRVKTLPCEKSAKKYCPCSASASPR